MVIMATVCDACGHRDNEVKSGTGIEPKGTCIKLRLTSVADLSRDLLKVGSVVSLFRDFLYVQSVSIVSLALYCWPAVLHENYSDS